MTQVLYAHMNNKTIKKDEKTKKKIFPSFKVVISDILSHDRKLTHRPLSLACKWPSSHCDSLHCLPSMSVPKFPLPVSTSVIFDWGPLS
jgi:hypothetical protein